MSSINPRSTSPQFDPGHEDGVAQVAMNVAAAHSLSGHLRSAIEQQKSLGRYVLDCLIAFAEQLASAAHQAAGVLEGDEQPTDPDSVDDVQPSPAPYFSVSVAEDGLIDVEMTTKMAHLLSRILRDYRDWRWDQGFALPPVVGAFGAECGNLSRIARPMVPARPIVQLPEQPAGSPLARFLRPQAG